MSDAREFFTCPGGLWLRDPVLNGCTEDAIAIFKTICESSNAEWRIEVSPTNHAFSVRQCFKDPERFRRWSEQRIRPALDQLRARGLISLATANDREWLEVIDRLTYCKGHKAQKALDPPKQAALPMDTGPTLFALPSAEDAPRARIPLRGEKKENRRDESPARAAAPAARVPVPVNRSDRGGDGERFARSEEDCSDEAWPMISQAVGLVELTQRGALWLHRLKQDRMALFEAASDYHALNPSEKSAVKNRGAWMTERYEHHARAKATA